ncbi:Bombyxin A-1-like [Papilio machaon]|uniref:Bombyxin A-1-like n=1 Tax=Papilio machaon TaxID=76193 RepID=A0A194RG26_PAPMA|nr:Bombyxin A-1-like [Papilio machaon]
MSPYTIVFLIFTVLATVYCQWGQEQVYCGRRLATTLAFLCDETPMKRNHMVDSNWPIVTSQWSNSLGRRKRQVVAECCDKPCAIDELMSYC